MNTLVKEKVNGYTQSAWEGKMYDPNLSIKEIAERIRFFAKKQFPECKFSVTIERYSGGQSMNLCLMSAPYDVFETPTLEKAELSKGYGTAEQKLDSWERTIKNGHHQVNHYYVENDSYLNENGKAIMKFLNNAATVYNFDDSDAQSDYFHTNFYVHLAVGKWDKPFIKTK